MYADGTGWEWIEKCIVPVQLYKMHLTSVALH